ncbi:branched-chain amino acid ABC transporter substrate-binding protein [Actinomadura craniellae]|uniref:Branched-chain amino acid ABC transporter substrate-binding protein n=1 Tax=Actinomadura craniellae TaxID=2231787 RepID=A0A365GY00_9ACTN|nr:ABC transporter substrate-binding protein [Actinomadura craniellae]RAY11715.1 branched-chain amino acid ABC transporter substrate-binding protein [Actinomadura craniellae]
MVRRGRRTGAGAVLAALALVLTGCGNAGNAAAAPGVSDEPCPRSAHKDRGCIYLGVLTDRSAGPFRELALKAVESQRAFWKRVNEQGGIGGRDIDVTTYVRDNKYDPAVQRRVYQEIQGKVLAIAQTLGTPTTNAILPYLRADRMLAVPASFTSAWNFEDFIVYSGANYCFDAMNSVDYAVDQYKIKSVLVVHYAGDYGADAAAGIKIAAAGRKLQFARLETPAGPERQKAAVDAVLRIKPDLVYLGTGPAEVGAIVGQTTARGYRGRFIGSGPSWDKALLATSAGPALKARYEQSTTFKPFHTDSPGHQALRQALGPVEPSDSYIAGWALSYPLKAALQRAAADGNLTRDGLFRAVKQLTSVDYEGVLPSGAGNFSGDPDTAALRKSTIAAVDAAALTGVVVRREPFTGPTAEAYRFTAPCYRSL